jgi:hypothetical protein
MAGTKNENIGLREEIMNQKNDCRYYESCSAPMCPILSDEQNINYCWYPDEDICRRRKGLPDWVRQQRKIAKKAKPDNYRYYLTLEMLKVRFRVTSSVKGLDPDNLNEEAQLRAWRKRNKGSKKKKITEKQREQKRRILMETRKTKWGFNYGQ